MEYDERSPLWGLGATAAAASGMGMSIYQGRQELLKALRVGERDIAAETTNMARQMQRFASNTPSLSFGSVSEHQAGVISLLKNNDMVKQDIASVAYESILAGKRTSHVVAYDAYKNVLKQSDPLSAYKEAGRLSESLHGNIGRFSSGINAISAGGESALERIGEFTSNVGASSGQYLSTRVSTDINGMGKEAAAMAQGIQSKLSAVAGDTPIKWTGYYNISDKTASGDIFNTPMMTGKVAGVNVNIPLKDTGVVYGGSNLTTRYATRQAHGVGEKGFNYIERYTDMLKDVLESKSSQSLKNQSIHKVNTDMIGALHARDGAARAQAIWTLPPNVLPSGGLAKAKMTGLQSVSALGQGFDEDAVQGLLNRSLYPVGSPNAVAAGTYYNQDIREGLYGPLGKLFPVDKRPDQFIRSNFGITEAAKANASSFQGAFGEGYSRLNRKITGELYDDAITNTGYVAPQLTTFYAKSGSAGFASDELNKIMFAEEALISDTATDMMEYERVVQNKISLNEGFRGNKTVLGALEGAEIGDVRTLDSPVGGSKFLGIDQSTGKELWAKHDESIRTDVIAAELTDVNQATLYTRERHKLNKGDHWKFFSEESKYMGNAADDQRMRGALRAAGAEDLMGGVGKQKLESIYSSKLIEKNTMARMTQQMEAMSMFAGEQIDNNKFRMRQRVLAKELIEDPMETLGVRALLEAGTADAEFEIDKNMVSMAKKFGFNERQMGLTFGLMDGDSAARLGIGSAVESSPGVVGISKMRLGDIATDGVGGLASLEHSGFRMLAMKGEEGQRMAAELSGRFIGKGELEPAERLLHSTVNKTDRLLQLKGAAGFEGGIVSEKRTLSQLLPQDIVADKGRYVELGRRVKSLGGSHQLYIPGTDEAPSMMLSSLSNGDPVDSPIVSKIGALRGAIQSGNEEAIEAAGLALRSTAHQSFELQGAAKGKVLGSRFLTGIRQQVDESTDNAFKISRDTGSQMFDDLLDRSSSDSQTRFLKKQKDSFLAGEMMTGGGWRHPTTGPESFQFVNYKMDKNLKGPLISAPARLGSISIDGGEARSVDFSHMVGMKGDFDKDMYGLSVISDEQTASMARKYVDGGSQENYNKYLSTHYAMEDAIGKGDVGKRISQMNKTEAFSIGGRKLTEAKIATPKVNVALQKLKIGLQYSAPEKYRPLGELFYHLEEAAIGGKHGVMEGSLYQNIAHAVEQKDTKTMESVLTGLLGDKRSVNTSMNMGGKTITNTVDIDPSSWARTAIESAANVSDDVDVAYKAAQVSKGKQSLKEVNQVVEMMYKRKAGSLDVAQSVMFSNQSKIEGISEVANRTIRKGGAKFSAVSRALSKVKGPALIGGAAALGIAMMAPSVSGSLGTVTSSPRGGKNISHEDLGPPGGPGMNIAPARMMNSPKVYDTSGSQMSSRAKIRMSMGDSNASSRNFMNQARALSSNGNVKIRTVDDRSVLDAQRLANKIHERL